MFESAHEYGKFILRSQTGRVYEEIRYCDKVPGSMERARKEADAWVERMNKLWNKQAA